MQNKKNVSSTINPELLCYSCSSLGNLWFPGQSLVLREFFELRDAQSLSDSLAAAVRHGVRLGSDPATGDCLAHYSLRLV